MKTLANTLFCLWLLIWLPYSKIIHIKVRLPGKRLGKSKSRGCKSSGDQVEFLRTTRLAAKKDVNAVCNGLAYQAGAVSQSY